MDRSGALPRSAHIDVWSRDGTLLLTVEATITGATITAELPAFPTGTRGAVVLREDTEPNEPPMDEAFRELPTEATTVVFETG